jgi:protein-S-isoprenylcysteine O-methyltransferase Ste14
MSILGGLALVAIMSAILFGSAGRSDLPLFWAYLGVWAAALVTAGVVSDPTLTRERLRPGPGGKDYLSIIVVTPLWLGLHVVAGLDVGRFHWSDDVPLPLQVVGLAVMAAALAVMMWALAVNRFFSSVVRIQSDRGHHVITGGPYRVVRHPAYACVPFLFIGGGLALGSWLTALLSLVMLPLFLRRTAQEDRTLREQLEGYAAYAERVRYRLFPGVW